MAQDSCTRKTINTEFGKIILLNRNNRLDIEFTREAFGSEAEDEGWFRISDRIYILDQTIDQATAIKELQKHPPASVLDEDLPDLGIEEPIRELYRMEDGTIARWIRHPNGIPEKCREHWRDHQILIEFESPQLGCTAYHSIHRMAVLEGADSKPRYFAPGGLRWINYPDKEAAISDALDMSLAVAMKIQVTGTPCTGSTGLLAGYTHLHFEIRIINSSNRHINTPVNPHRFWFDGIGIVTCFDKDKKYPDIPYRITYPVPCRDDR